MWILTHILYKALHLLKGLLLLGFSTALCILIFSMGQENERPMRTTVVQRVWALLGPHHEHGSKELLWACIGSSPSPNSSVTAICKLWENSGWPLAGPCLVRTRSWDMKLLKSNTLEDWHFTVFSRVCMVNHLPLKESHPAKYQIPVLKHKTFETLRDKTTRILNLGRTIPSLVF